MAATNCKDYEFLKIEPHWQTIWEETKAFRAESGSSKPKFYVLDMFPYPSGAGLHIGHPEGYTATDILARYKRARGCNVLHPIGWDAFGLPAEQHAVKTGTHPAVTTRENIATFRRQIRRLGLGYDWDREVDTTDPDYYRWTQWIFLELFDRGLAYQAEVPVNWCPALGTVLANEEVKDGVSERGGHPVVRVPMRQWMLRITAYAERLLADLDGLDWPESIKAMQRHWIGRSEGAEVDFAIAGHDGLALRIYTTRPDTLFGATYMVLAPEHPLVTRITTDAQREAVQAYVDAATRKSELDRTELAKDKTGVFTGAYATNPVDGRPTPIWIADYVLVSYGTGAIMAVPAHDTRDWEFAKALGLPIVQVVKPLDGSAVDVQAAAFVDEGIAVASGPYDGLTTAAFKARVSADLEARGVGKRAVNYRLRDWLFSRQRYWGEPIPILYGDDGTPVALPRDALPLTLPEVASYQPSGTGESPLATLTDWVHTLDAEGRPARRETHTMPQWAGSCWYYLRYMDPTNTSAPFDKAKADYWLPVDLYVGGAEHAVLHLLYARFWHKVLYDAGLVSCVEPFQKLVNQGMILGSDNQKMSKSRGNVVNPDDIIGQFGADAMRLYEMFMGPLEAVKPWQTKDIVGIERFLDKVWRLASREPSGALDADTNRVVHKTIAKVTEDIEHLRFNTAISALMILTNHLVGLTGSGSNPPRAAMEALALCLSPFAPHLGEEIWERLGHTGSIAHAPWPTFDPALTIEARVEVVVQVNGKIRARLEVDKGTDAAQLEAQARAMPRIADLIAAQAVRKVVIVADKLVNFVVA